MSNNNFAVFTKPWKNESLDELGTLIAEMGFNAVEYPIRDGFQVQPADGVEGVKKLTKTLGKYNIKVESLAVGIEVKSPDGNLVVNETAFNACGEAGIPIIRICERYDRNLGFHQNIEALRRKYDKVLPYCQKNNVTLGIQMHFGPIDVTCSWDSYILLKDYDPKYIAAVWDAGHAGLAGENPRYGLDCIWDQLCMVNLKSAYWYRKNPTNFAEEAQWGVHWVTGKNGMCSWKDTVDYLKKRDYKGTICLTAEYSDEHNVEKYAREDLNYVKELLKG